MERKKEEISYKIKRLDKKTIKLKDIVSSLKITATLGIIFSSFALLVILVLCTLTTISISVNTIEQSLNNNSTIEYVAKINSYSISVAKDAISNITNKGLFIAFDVILPSIIVLIAFILLIFANKKILDFIKDVKTNKNLFTTQKLEELKVIRSYFLTIGLLLFIVFDFSYFFIYLILVITLEIILYLFNYCVNAEIEKAKE